MYITRAAISSGMTIQEKFPFYTLSRTVKSEQISVTFVFKLTRVHVLIFSSGKIGRN